MFHSTKVLTSLLVVVGLYYVDTQNIGVCVDGLTSALTQNSGAVCPAMSDYMKCVMKELNLVNVGLDSSSLNMLESQLNTQLSAQGISCNIDIQTLYNELREEANSGSGSGTTRAPATFETADSIGGCIDALTNAAIGAGKITCDAATPYVKCMVRVLKLHEQSMTDEDIHNFENQVEAELRKQNANCNLDVRRIINELRGGGGSVTSGPAPSFDLNSPAFQNCAKDNIADTQDPACGEIKDVLKCVMLDNDAYKKVTSSQLDRLQSLINTAFGNQCSVDVKEIQSELKSTNSAGRSSPAQAILLLMASILTFLFAQLL